MLCVTFSAILLVVLSPFMIVPVQEAEREDEELHYTAPAGNWLENVPALHYRM